MAKIYSVIFAIASLVYLLNCVIIKVFILKIKQINVHSN